MQLLTKKDFKNVDKMKAICEQLGCRLYESSSDMYKSLDRNRLLGVFNIRRYLDADYISYVIVFPLLDNKFCSYDIFIFPQSYFFGEDEKRLYRLMFVLNKRIIEGN